MNIDTLFEEVFHEYRHEVWPTEAKYELIKVWAQHGRATANLHTETQLASLRITLPVFTERKANADSDLH